MSRLRRMAIVIVPALITAAVILPVASPALAAWEFDAEVTEVGRSAERARQLLYFVMTHPTDYTNAGTRVVWGAVRNFVYIGYVLIIVLVGVSTMVFQGKWIPIGVGLVAWGEEKLGKWIPRLVILILFATFSYAITAGLAAVSDHLSGMFIERYGGCNLFNIKFSGPGSTCDYSLDALKAMEKNYDFIGYRETSAVNNEAAHKSLFLVRFTTFTYNFLSIMLLLRHVILWFLIIVSPIIALLFPFVLIRNVAWIWIAEFLRWLFYGPLVAIFLAGLVQIWQFSIPYGFDFSRTQGTDPAVVFPTAISILVGGPAQGADPNTHLNPSAQISGTNSLNYVDTYAEYIISLIMLWTVILLPFLLLRIFRDYCCEIFGARQETLYAMYDKVKGWGQPPPAGPGSGPGPRGPSDTPRDRGPTGQIAMDLPYRQIKSLPKTLSKQDIAKISQAQTSDIARQLGISSSSMRDIALADMNQQRRTMMRQSLQALARPSSVSSEAQQEHYQRLRQELSKRANLGDQRAQRILDVAHGKLSAKSMTDRSRTLAQQQIKDKKLPTSQSMSASEKLSHVEKQAKEKGIPIVMPGGGGGSDHQTQAGKGNRGPTPIPAPGKPVKIPDEVDIEEYEEIKEMWVNHYRLSEVPMSEKLKNRKQWLEHDIKTIQNAMDKISSTIPETKESGFEDVASILPFLLLGDFTEEQTLAYLKAKLSAAKQVLNEMIAEEQIKKQAEEAAQKEEKELVEVETDIEEEDLKTLEATRSLARELPPEKDEKKLPNRMPDAENKDQEVGSQDARLKDDNTMLSENQLGRIGNEEEPSDLTDKAG